MLKLARVLRSFGLLKDYVLLHDDADAFGMPFA